MAKYQALKFNYSNETTNKKFSKTFSNVPEGTIADTDDAKEIAGKYSKIVDGTFTDGNYSTVVPFEA